LILGFALFFTAYGALYKAVPIMIIGGVALVGSMMGWAIEPSAAPHDDDHDDDHDHGAALAGAGSAGAITSGGN
jgi:hypothetical protein